MIKKRSSQIITRDKEILGGTPVFKGTRVPIETLWNYLKAGDTLEVFLQDFLTVKKEQAIALLVLFQQAIPEDTQALFF